MTVVFLMNGWIVTGTKNKNVCLYNINMSQVQQKYVIDMQKKKVLKLCCANEEHFCQVSNGWASFVRRPYWS